MRKNLVRDNGGRVYVPMFRVLARLTDNVKGMKSGGSVTARKTNGERTTGNMTCRKVTGEKVTVEKEGGTSRCDQTEANNKDDDRKKRGRKERNNRESGRGIVSNQGDAKRRSYSEAVIEGALRTERVFMGDSILRKTDRTLSKGEDVVVCLPGARIEHVTERVENVLGHGQGGLY